MYNELLNTGKKARRVKFIERNMARELRESTDCIRSLAKQARLRPHFAEGVMMPSFLWKVPPSMMYEEAATEHSR